MQDLTTLTATQLAAAILERRISSLEVVDAHLAQIATRNPALNAIITLDEEGARKRALEADAALAKGEVWGPLHGVPMTLKDCHSTLGMRTTAGHPPLADYVPSEDGTVATRLKAAGAIIMGKTNVSELLADIQSVNPVFGRTNNPHDLTRTSGGSSGGAAAALAAGMTPLDIGSDFAGSIRIPAHFCGVYGLKPTEHRVSMNGHIPPIPPFATTHPHSAFRIPHSAFRMWSIGPLARSLDDLALALRVIAGPDEYDPDVVPFQWQGTPTPEAKDLRIAWAQTFPGVPVSNVIRETMMQLALELDRAGARIEVRLPAVDFKEQSRLRVEITEMERAVSLPQEDTPPPMLADYLTALQRRDTIILEWERFFEEWDALLCPVSMTTAFPHCEQDTPIIMDGAEVNYWRVIGHCAPFNLTGHPAVVIPVARDSEGLPIGLQLVGRRWGEEQLLAIATRIVETLDNQVNQAIITT